MDAENGETIKNTKAHGYTDNNIVNKNYSRIVSIITEFVSRQLGLHPSAVFIAQHDTSMIITLKNVLTFSEQQVYAGNRITMDMRFLEKAAVMAQIELEIDAIRDSAPTMSHEEIVDKYGVHPVIVCPDFEAADAMVEACTKIYNEGDTAGGLVELVIQGLPAGLGEPVFEKLDGELACLMGIGAVKGVEIGAGFSVKDMTRFECNERMHTENGNAVFDSNNAGGITGGLATGQDVIVRLAVKPTPTIDKKQHTIDNYSMETKNLSAITRRDPTITNRIWPVAESNAALILLDQLMAHLAYQNIREKI